MVITVYFTMKNKIIVMASCLFIILMIIFPAVTEVGTKTAIIIWANSIIPVLLPFFIFSEFIKKTGDLHKLSPKVYPFVIAFLSGYPMGAKVVGDFVRSKTVSIAQGKYILSYSLITGPAFIIFTIGSFIGSTKAAILVAVSHYFAALLNKGFYYTSDQYIKPHIISKPDLDYMENFSIAIGSGFKAMATILAYLMFFTIGINILDFLGVFSLIGNEAFSSVIKGLMEMTLGTNLVGMCDISMKLKTVLASVLVSFGGLSVIGQSMSMTRRTGIGVRDILEIKITHSLIAGILATLLVNNVVL